MPQPIANFPKRKGIAVAVALGLAYLVGFLVAPVHGQGQADQQARMMELKAAMAKNKAQLATYTWKETVTISLKGEVKKVQHYQVRQGADGKPQKTPLDPAAAPQQPQGGRLKQRIVAKKKEEFEDYAERMKTTVAMYVPPDKDLIQAAVQKGIVSFAPQGDSTENHVHQLRQARRLDGDLLQQRKEKHRQHLGEHLHGRSI